MQKAEDVAAKRKEMRADGQLDKDDVLRYGDPVPVDVLKSLLDSPDKYDLSRTSTLASLPPILSASSISDGAQSTQCPTTLNSLLPGELDAVLEEERLYRKERLMREEQQLRALGSGFHVHGRSGELATFKGVPKREGDNFSDPGPPLESPIPWTSGGGDAVLDGTHRSLNQSLPPIGKFTGDIADDPDIRGHGYLPISSSPTVAKTFANSPCYGLPKLHSPYK